LNTPASILAKGFFKASYTTLLFLNWRHSRPRACGGAERVQGILKVSNLNNNKQIKHSRPRACGGAERVQGILKVNNLIIKNK